MTERSSSSDASQIGQVSFDSASAKVEKVGRLPLAESGEHVVKKLVPQGKESGTIDALLRESFGKASQAAILHPVRVGTSSGVASSSASQKPTGQVAVEESLTPLVHITVEKGQVRCVDIPQRAKRPVSLLDRMKELNVPGVSIAVIKDGVIEWSEGYGELKDPKILSQAASTSKIITSLTVLSLVKAGKLSLDTDVREILKDEELWKRLDPEGMTKERKITVRQLLSHTAGISSGKREYYRKDVIKRDIALVEREIASLRGEPLKKVQLKAAEEKRSSLLKILEEAGDGTIPSAEDIARGECVPVHVETTPGTHFAYSNPGFSILELVVEKVTEKPFTEVVRENVLTPLGMDESAYFPSAGRTVHGNDSMGKPLLGSWQVIPFVGAGGLWTNAQDMAKLIPGLQRAISGEDTRIIDRERAQEMLTVPETSDYGLGVVVERPERAVRGEDDPVYFMHEGSSPGFRNFIVANNKKQGVVILTNSENGVHLYQEILEKVSKEYEWQECDRVFLHLPKKIDLEETSPVPNLAAWASQEGVGGTYVARGFGEDGKPEEHRVLVVFDPAKGKVFAHIDGGEAEGRSSLELTPLGKKVACFPAGDEDYQVCRFEGVDGKMSVQLWGKTHIREGSVDS